MSRFFQYYSQVQTARGRFGSLPPWAQGIVAIFALPGLILAGLSLLLLGVSILALFLLTVPVYGLLRRITGGGPMAAPPATVGLSSMFAADDSPGRKSVQVRVVE